MTFCVIMGKKGLFPLTNLERIFIMIDLLAPVGDFECLKAAVQNGANSVYFGADLFSARAFAHNFGQVIIAVVVTNQLAIMYYFLFLVISSVITGVFTGVCAQTMVKKLKNINF